MDKKEAQNTNMNVLSVNRHQVILSVAIKVSQCLFPLSVLLSSWMGDR